jgi:hypothetical protein
MTIHYSNFHSINISRKHSNILIIDREKQLQKIYKVSIIL